MSIEYYMPFEAYRHAAGISKHQLDNFAKCPAYYKYKLTSRDQPTEAMAFGKLVHAVVLEPDTVNDRFKVRPDDTRGNSKSAREAMANWLHDLKSTGCYAVDPDKDLSKARAMHRSLLANPDTSKLLSLPRKNEVSVFAEVRKARPDAITSNWDIIDLKTCQDASPEGFAKDCANYRYHVQAAYYIDTLRMATDRDCTGGFHFLAVEKTAPYLCAVYTLDEAAIDKGRVTYQAELAGVLDLLEWGNYPGYRSGEISLPKWTK